MKLFGITGGAGMGKSTTASFLEKRGTAVIDTDALARRIVEPGQPALAEISAAFGPSVLTPEGALDRKKLARHIFSDPAERARLEAILHPKIRELWGAEVESWREAGHAQGAVIIPLLYETHAESHFDAVICVACGTASQMERLKERGWSRTEIRQRLEAQWPVEEKISRADFVIWTDTTLEAHAAQLERVMRTATDVAPAAP